MNTVLLEGEQLIAQTDFPSVQLTTHRIRQENKGQEGPAFTSVFLENISSIAVTRINKVMLVILGVVALLAGVALMSERQMQPYAMGAFVLGVLLIVAYFTSRKQIVKVASNGGDAIIMITTGTSHTMILAFVDLLEKAKHDRIGLRGPIAR